MTVEWMNEWMTECMNYLCKLVCKHFAYSRLCMYISGLYMYVVVVVCCDTSMTDSVALAMMTMTMKMMEEKQMKNEMTDLERLNEWIFNFFRFIFFMKIYCINFIEIHMGNGRQSIYLIYVWQSFKGLKQIYFMIIRNRQVFVLQIKRSCGIQGL